MNKQQQDLSIYGNDNEKENCFLFLAGETGIHCYNNLFEFEKKLLFAKRKKIISTVLFRALQKLQKQITVVITKNNNAINDTNNSNSSNNNNNNNIIIIY